MKFPPRLVFLGALLSLIRGSVQTNNTNVEQKTYSPPLRDANFMQCKKEIEAGSILSSNPSFRPVFVNAEGTPVDGPEGACGVDYETCINYCHTGSERPKWSFFSPQFTAWLLPFIALTAQLPYQAVTTWDNLMSALLTVGSPALAAYSLILTFLGTRWLEQQCAAALHCMPASTADERQRQVRLTGIFRDMKGVLCLAQQEPYENLDFQPLPKDIQGEVDWWGRLYGTVQKSKRGYTASFVHQLLWVSIAFAFSIVDAFGSEKIGNNATAFGLAIALVWQWETPIVMGWVLVGTSTVHSAVQSAITELGDTAGFFRSYPGNLARKRGGFKGDRARPGPIFNYARAFIWTHRAEALISRYQPLHIHAGQPLQLRWRTVSFKHVLFSSVLALILQWSTSGASIILSYLTPAIGLSCRSGGFLLYTVSSTVVLLSLMFSSFLSELSVSASEANRTHMTHLYGYAAVILRTLGKTIAVLNRPVHGVLLKVLSGVLLPVLLPRHERNTPVLSWPFPGPFQVVLFTKTKIT